MLDAIESLLHKITGRQHHFKITLRYTPDLGHAGQYVDRYMNIWVPDRRTAGDDRTVKQSIGPGFIRDIPRRYLKNGALQIVSIQYIGWFRPIGDTQ